MSTASYIILHRGHGHFPSAVQKWVLSGPRRAVILVTRGLQRTSWQRTCVAPCVNGQAEQRLRTKPAWVPPQQAACSEGTRQKGGIRNSGGKPKKRRMGGGVKTPPLTFSIINLTTNVCKECLKTVTARMRHFSTSGRVAWSFDKVSRLHGHSFKVRP